MTVKSRLLELLEQHKGETLSGEDIGRELSCTRAAVWKAVNSLRQEGYPIEAGPNKGYMLARESNLISAEGIRLFLDPIFPIYCYFSYNFTVQYLHSYTLPGIVPVK